MSLPRRRTFAFACLKPPMPALISIRSEPALINTQFMFIRFGSDRRADTPSTRLCGRHRTSPSVEAKPVSVQLDAVIAKLHAELTLRGHSGRFALFFEASAWVSPCFVPALQGEPPASSGLEKIVAASGHWPPPAFHTLEVLGTVTCTTLLCRRQPVSFSCSTAHAAAPGFCGAKGLSAHRVNQNVERGPVLRSYLFVSVRFLRA